LSRKKTIKEKSTYFLEENVQVDICPVELPGVGPGFFISPIG
jgi:hypothetical protein